MLNFCSVICAKHLSCNSLNRWCSQAAVCYFAQNISRTWSNRYGFHRPCRYSERGMGDIHADVLVYTKSIILRAGVATARAPAAGKSACQSKLSACDRIRVERWRTGAPALAASSHIIRSAASIRFSGWTSRAATDVLSLPAAAHARYCSTTGTTAAVWAASHLVDAACGLRNERRTTCVVLRLRRSARSRDVFRRP